MKQQTARREPIALTPARGRASAFIGFPWTALLGVAALAVVWRLALAAQMPCMSRDGATFCWMARDLVEHGVAALRDPAMEQHPLFPLAIAGVHWGLRAAGMAESPLLWQGAAQTVTMVSGVLLVAASGLLAAAICRSVSRSDSGTAVVGDPQVAAKWAFALAAVTPLYCTISVDALSESLHLFLYVGAGIMLTRLDSAGGCTVLGLLSALAFLTRPEGCAPLLAGTLVLALRGIQERHGKPLLGAVLAIVTFCAVAAPYWATIGTFTPKLRKQTVEEFVPTAAAKPDQPHSAIARMQAKDAGPSPNVRSDTGFDADTQEPVPAQAALVRRVLTWPAAAVESCYQLMRAGRVIVPVLAIGTLLALRAAWRRPAVLGLLLCIAIHYALTVALLKRHGYLDARHTLPALALMLPIAAVGLAGLLADGRWRRLGLLLGASTLVTLGIYAMRVPNRLDAHLARAADWLRSRTRSEAYAAASGPASRPTQIRLLGGSSQKRLAFYADLRFVPWPENEPDEVRRVAELKSHLLGERPEWFAIEIDGTERANSEFAGNQALATTVLNDAQIAPLVVEVHRESNEIGIRLELYRLKQPNAP